MTYQLYQGDCLKIMPTLQENSVAMVFADLPYGILTHREWDKQLPLSDLWACLQRITTADCVSSFTAKMPLASALYQSNTRYFRYDLVWEKHLASNFLRAKKMPLCMHENLLIFAGTKHTYNPQMRPESERKDLRAKLTKCVPLSKWHSKPFIGSVRASGLMYPRSLIRTNESRKRNIHPTQKPVALLEWLIATYSNPGDTVLDPVFGSCTTGVACARLGRNFIGIEKDATYFAAGKARLEAEHARLAEGAA